MACIWVLSAMVKVGWLKRPLTDNTLGNSKGGNIFTSFFFNEIYSKPAVMFRVSTVRNAVQDTISYKNFHSFHNDSWQIPRDFKPNGYFVINMRMCRYVFEWVCIISFLCCIQHSIRCTSVVTELFLRVCCWQQKNWGHQSTKLEQGCTNPGPQTALAIKFYT